MTFLHARTLYRQLEMQTFETHSSKGNVWICSWLFDNAVMTSLIFFQCSHKTILLLFHYLSIKTFNSDLSHSLSAGIYKGFLLTQTLHHTSSPLYTDYSWCSFSIIIGTVVTTWFSNTNLFTLSNRKRKMNRIARYWIHAILMSCQKPGRYLQIMLR